MKFKGKLNPTPKKPQAKERGNETRQRAWLWLAAVVLAITFLAGECANLLPFE